MIRLAPPFAAEPVFVAEDYVGSVEIIGSRVVVTLKNGRTIELHAAYPPTPEELRDSILEAITLAELRR